MGTTVEIVESDNAKEFKNEMEARLRNLHNEGIKTDVKFSTSSDGDGYMTYTAMIIIQTNLFD